ncbi:MAG TPA: hypothetical protein VFQ39_17105 [Longimicrobium sp.]|nr:hypothetical protein [Longimicrobium sp.]
MSDALAPRIRVLEWTRAFAPLGIRFWDAGFDVPVVDELRVHAWLRDGDFAPVRATRSGSGIYSFADLPGRRAQERPAGDEEHAEALGPTQEYVIAVDDPAGRWLPAAFSVTLPLGYRGEFLSASAASAPGGAGRAYLFPSASRPVSARAAAIRADLWDADLDAPAAYAVLRATIDGATHTAVADEAGRALLLFPVPAVDRLRLGSPPGSGQGAPAGNRWPVGVQAWYDPGALRFPFAGRAELDPAWAARPSLKSVLDEQRAALVWADDGQAPAAGLTAELAYGEELVLRTAGSGGSLHPRLWLSAAASPP